MRTEATKNTTRHRVPLRVLAVAIATATAAMLAACGGSDGDTTPTPVPVPVQSGQVQWDSTWATKGSVSVALRPFGGVASLVVEQPDGKLLLAGARALEASVSASGAYLRSANKLFVMRLLASGEPDASFGVAGVSEFSLRGADRIDDMVVMPDGRITLLAYASEPCEERGGFPYLACVVNDKAAVQGYVLASLQAGGALAVSATSPGFESVSMQAGFRPKLSAAGSQVLLMTANSDGRLASAGWTLGRYHANGTLDTTFGANGIVASRCNSEGGVIQQDAAGGVWVAAPVRALANSTAQGAGLCVERLTAAGQPHPAIAAPIKQVLDTAMGIPVLKVLPDQSLQVASLANTGFATPDMVQSMRFSEVGKLLTDYGVKGVARVPLSVSGAQEHYVLHQIAVEGNGALAVRGSIQANTGAVVTPTWTRVTAQGVADTGFGTAGSLRGTLNAAGAPTPLAGSAIWVDSQQHWWQWTVVREQPEGSGPAQAVLSRWSETLR